MSNAERGLLAPPIEWRVAQAERYETLAKQTRGAFAVPLAGDRAFWSKGWRGCQFNCGQAVDDWSRPMVERITVKNGYVTRGFYCR